jgi:predicted transcriptional regulator
MAAMSTTSMRLPDDLRERYDALARVTGQTRNDLIIAAMGEYIEREMREIALIQEGFDAIDRGEFSPLEEVVQRLAARGMLDRAALERDRAQASADRERATA